MTWPAPTVNHWVHYVAPGSADGKFPKVCRAALVIEVGEPDPVTGIPPIGLCVFNPTGFHFRPLPEGVKYDGDEDPAGFTWHWPERA